MNIFKIKISVKYKFMNDTIDFEIESIKIKSQNQLWYVNFDELKNKSKAIIIPKSTPRD